MKESNVCMENIFQFSILKAGRYNYMKAVLFITSYLEELSLDLFKRIQKEAKKRNRRLICYAGGPFHNEKGERTERSQIYDVIDSTQVEGILLNAGAVGHNSTPDFLNDFVNRFPQIPVASLSFPVQSALNVSVDNYAGIYSIVNHLISEHQLTKIGFVKGPNGHPEAEERFKAYKDAMAAHDIQVDEEFIAEGDFSEYAGVQAVQKFLKSKKSIEAIVCVDDDSALGVVSELKKRNVKIPRDIAVTGFDDILAAGKMIPSLTTVAQPYDTLISEAFDIATGIKHSNIEVPTIAVKRESCGCRGEDLVSSGIDIEDVVDFEEAVNRYQSMNFQISSEIKSRLIKALRDDIEEKIDFALVDELSDILSESGDIHAIQSALTYLVSATPISHRSISVFHQARIFLHKISERKCSMDKIDFENLNIHVNEVVMNITSCPDFDTLYDILITHLPQFGCNECHLVKKDGDKGSLQFSFKDGRPQKFSSDHFTINEILPKGVMNGNSNYMVLPLDENLRLFGYAVYELRSEHADIIATLNIQIAAAISMLKLVDVNRSEKIRIHEKNVQIQRLIAPMLDAIKQVSIQSQEKIKEMQEIKEQISVNNVNFSRSLEMLKEISSKVDAVMESVSVINDISENVNVLAINTSIQSAHAGSFGKAFGVIATEIRQLSDRTAENAKRISDDLSSTVNEFKGFRDINKTNVKSFKDFSDKINHFMVFFEEISSSMEILSSSSNNIASIMDTEDSTA